MQQGLLDADADIRAADDTDNAEQKTTKALPGERR
jgi:hypothetical protein